MIAVPQPQSSCHFANIFNFSFFLWIFRNYYKISIHHFIQLKYLKCNLYSHHSMLLNSTRITIQKFGVKSFILTKAPFN